MKREKQITGNMVLATCFVGNIQYIEKIIFMQGS